jgi:poly(ribitol-phosphate) beta-N-acetylglucosaminyltransferase
MGDGGGCDDYCYRELIKVSVIVPVFNPGSNIEQCISSLLGQSLPGDEYELIFVDDGSTDETPARLDELAQAHANVRVEHIPNSGWPGRPRNIGIGLARGEFVYFVDNDDWLGPKALERLYADGVENRSDIVIGKVVGHGKVVPRTLFRRNRADLTVEWGPLLRLLTPHKLFRKALLDEHGIRFPEGRRRLEDHVFVVHSYFHAERISVLADYPCYHWMHRDADVNASWRRLDPVGYFDNVREVLDLVTEHTEPGELRDRMYAHWYRGKMLGRVGGGPFVRRDPPYNRELHAEIRRLALERYGTDVERFLPFNLRIRSRLLRDGTYESLEKLAAFENELHADVTLRELRWEEGVLALELDARLSGEREPFAVERHGTRMRWLPPRSLRAELPGGMLDVTDELEDSQVQILLRSTRNQAEYVVPSRREMVFVRAPGEDQGRAPVMIAATEIDPRTAAAGAPLRAGDWQVQVLVDLADFNVVADELRRAPSGRLARLRPQRPKTLTLTVTRDGRLIERPALKRRAARRLPRLTRRVRRFRRRGRAAIAKARRRVAA